MNYKPVVYFDQLLGAVRTQKLVETFISTKINNNQLSRGEICVANLTGPLANGASLDRFFFVHF